MKNLRTMKSYVLGPFPTVRDMYLDCLSEIKYSNSIACRVDDVPFDNNYITSWPRLAAAIDTAVILYRHAMCYQFGHRWSNTGHDAENGSEDLCCRRCGMNVRNYF